MSAFEEYFNPELEEVLRDIARDPRAKMLRVPSSGALVYATREPRVTSMAPGLTSAEREVLRVHREALAQLLLERSRIEFFAQAGGEAKWHRAVTSTESVDVPDEACWRAAAGVVVDRGNIGGADERVAIDLLAACVSDVERPAPSIRPMRFARAVQRLVPRDEAPIHVALDELDCAALSAAEAQLEGVLRGRASAVMRSLAWENHGLVLWRQGRLGDAHPSYANASCYPDRPTPAMSMLTLGVLMNDRDAAKRAAARVDDVVSTGSDAFGAYIGALETQLVRCDICVGGNSKQLARELDDGGDLPSRRILRLLGV